MLRSRLLAARRQLCQQLEQHQGLLNVHCMACTSHDVHLYTARLLVLALVLWLLWLLRLLLLLHDPVHVVVDGHELGVQGARNEAHRHGEVRQVLPHVPLHRQGAWDKACMCVRQASGGMVGPAECVAATAGTRRG